MLASTTSFPKKHDHVSRNKRRNYQPKKTIHSPKNNVTAKDTRPSLFFILLIWNSFCWLSDFLYFFSLLTINHKHKCIQAKTFKTQASWSLHSSLHFSYNDEEKVKKNIKWYNNATISCLPLIFKNISIIFACGIWHQMKLCAWRFKKKEQRNFNNK